MNAPRNQLRKQQALSGAEAEIADLKARLVTVSHEASGLQPGANVFDELPCGARVYYAAILVEWLGLQRVLPQQFLQVESEKATVEESSSRTARFSAHSRSFGNSRWRSPNGFVFRRYEEE